MRKLMWFTLGFGAACGLGTYLYRGWGLLAAAGGLLLLGILLAAFAGERLWLKRMSLAALGIAVGCCWFYGYDWIRISPAREADGQVLEIEFRASFDSWETDYGSAVDGTITLKGRQYRIRLYLDENLTVQPGDQIATTAKLRLTDEGGQNAPTFHRTNGILLLAYQRDEAVLTEGTPEIRDLPGILRERCLSILDACVPGEAASFAKALLLADRGDLTYNRSMDFKITGISHIVAVSGLHMSILFSLVYLSAGKRRYLTAMIGIPCVVFFAAMTGFTPSVTRAAIMQILMMLALALNREYDPPTALSFAALVMLTANPLVIGSVGFQLSFGSVAGIYLFAGSIRHWILERLPKGKRVWDKRLAHWLAGSVSITLSAALMTTPLVAYYYGTVSLIGLWTNLLVLPVISLIFYGAMLVCLLGMASTSAGAAAGAVLAWPIRYVFGVAYLLARVPLAAVYTRSSYVVFWLVFVYCLIGWNILSKYKRPLISICLGTIGLCFALMASYLEPLMYDSSVTVLDVGQGQCVLLQSRGSTFLVDCGGDYDQDAGTYAAETLLSQGIRRIDGLILTHYDRDHAGGVAYLAQRIDIEAVYLPPTKDTEGLLPEILAATEDAAHIWLVENLRISVGRGNLTVFPPKDGGAGNESCCAVLFQSEKCDTLITGDMSQFRERLLLSETELPDLEVLIVGHHGSKTSTSQELLDATAPDVAIISVGADNSYGHPAQEVLLRLAEQGCAVYRTDQNGDIIYRR